MASSTEVVVVTERWIALLLACLLDLAAGDPSNRWHPVAWMGGFIRWAEGKCTTNNRFGQFMHGFLLITAGGTLFTLPWILASEWIGTLPFGVEVIVIALLFKPTFALRRLIEASREIRRALAQADLVEARRLVGWHLVSRDTINLSEGQVASATVESLAENITDSLLAPVFYFAFLGLPGAWLYRFINTADAMIGYRTQRYEYLGKCAARLDDLLNWLPARLGALALVLASGLCRLNTGETWHVMIKEHNLTSSPNAGWTMAAAAGALEVRLEKIGCYCLNAGRAMPETEDIRRTERLVSLAALIGVIGIGGLGFGIATFCK